MNIFQVLLDIFTGHCCLIRNLFRLELVESGLSRFASIHILTNYSALSGKSKKTARFLHTKVIDLILQTQWNGCLFLNFIQMNDQKRDPVARSRVRVSFGVKDSIVLLKKCIEFSLYKMTFEKNDIEITLLIVDQILDLGEY